VSCSTVALGNRVDFVDFCLSLLRLRFLFLGLFWPALPFVEVGQKNDTENPPFVCLVDHWAADIIKSSCCNLKHTDRGKPAEASSAWWPSKTQTRILPVVAIFLVVELSFKCLPTVCLSSVRLPCVCQWTSAYRARALTVQCVSTYLLCSHYARCFRVPIMLILVPA